MSCNEEEKGTYTFPAGEYTRLKREFKAFWDEQMERAFQVAMTVYEKAQKTGGKAHVRDHLDDRTMRDGLVGIIDFNLLRAGKNGRLMKPKKKDLAKFKANAIFKEGGYFELGKASLCFDDEARQAVWEVDENNHAVRDARATVLAGFFFRFLNTVKWRGRTGGRVAYTNEYITDNGPCEPTYCDLKGYAVKDEEERMKFLLGRARRRR